MKTIRNHNKFASRKFGVAIPSVLVVLMFTATLVVPTLENTAYAYGQITSRSIEVSSSTVSATGTSYFVQFTTSSSIQDVIIDFCPDSPLYSDTCSSLTGFSAASAGFTAGTGTSGWSIT